MTYQVFLSDKAQRDLDAFPNRITKQILADCTRLADDPVPDGKRIKKLQGYKENLYRLRAGDGSRSPPVSLQNTHTGSKTACRVPLE